MLENSKSVPFSEIKAVRLYCLAIFNKDTGTSRVFAFNNFDEWLEAFCLYKDSNLYPYTFTQTIYISAGHPLYNSSFAEPVVFTNSILKLPK